MVKQMKLLRTKDLSWYSTDAWGVYGGPFISSKVGISADAFPELKPYTDAWGNVQLSIRTPIIEQIFMNVLLLVLVFAVFQLYLRAPITIYFALPILLILIGCTLKCAYGSYVKAKIAWWKLR